jgi:hypothetical protein
VAFFKRSGGRKNLHNQSWCKVEKLFINDFFANDGNVWLYYRSLTYFPIDRQIHIAFFARIFQRSLEAPVKISIVALMIYRRCLTHGIGHSINKLPFSLPFEVIIVSKLGPVFIGDGIIQIYAGFPLILYAPFFLICTANFNLYPFEYDEMYCLFIPLPFDPFIICPETIIAQCRSMGR